MSNSSIENKILGLLDRLRTENNSRDRDELQRAMEIPDIQSTRNRPPPNLGDFRTPTPRRALNLNLPHKERNIDSLETDNKLKEIMKISGILTIDGKQYRTDISEMEHIGELGSGTCGHVVKMRHKPSGAIIAVKQMRRSGNTEENKRIIMDIDVVLKSHDCPFIVQCLGCFITDSDVWICMELMATCFDKLLKRLKMSIPEYVLGKVTFATVKALSYLKEKHDVIHRDVKPSNILVDEKGNVKLCDFGISGRLVDSMAKTRSAGCAAYMAPERIEPPNPSKPDYDIRADVWSLGITLVELATGVFPYRDCNTDFEVLTKVLSEDPPSLPNDQDFSDEFRAFVACCLIKNYLDRPKYMKLLEEPFLKKYELANANVDEWFMRALKQADLLGANSPGRRYTPAPTITSKQRRFITSQQQQQNQHQFSNGGSSGSVGPPPPLLSSSQQQQQQQQQQYPFLSNNVITSSSTVSGLPPDGRNNSYSSSPRYTASTTASSAFTTTFLQHQQSPPPAPVTSAASIYNNVYNNQHYYQQLQNNSDKRAISVPLDASGGRFSPFSPAGGGGRFSPAPRRRDTVDDVQNITPVASPYQQRRIFSEGFWSSPISSPLPLRKHYQNPASPVAFFEQQQQQQQQQQYNHASNTSPVFLQRFYHQQKQYQQQQQHQHGPGTAASVVDGSSNDQAPPIKDDGSGKKRFASHIKLQLGGDRCNIMKSSRHQSPEPPPRLSRGSSQENAFLNQSPLAVRRNYGDFTNTTTTSTASPSLSRRYISPSPPQPPPRRLSESNSVPGSPQHFRARFHYTPEPQRRVYHNTDVS